MNETIEQTLARLQSTGNLRTIPAEGTPGVVDMCSNDYLGIAQRKDILEEFLAANDIATLPLTASASRLLARRQSRYNALEQDLERIFGRPALLFNSGYHANSGIIPAIASNGYFIVADRLVHASIIDGMRLSGAPFGRFRHNDLAHAAAIAQKAADQGLKPIFIIESIYSMDGDTAPVAEFVDLKRRFPGSLLYVDEAHAIGVAGDAGRGLAADIPDVDIIIGTFGKALASAGAFAICSEPLKQFLINTCRSLIFSTALPPLNMAWSQHTLAKALTMDSERIHLASLGKALAPLTGCTHNGHIQPLVVGDAVKAVELSAKLRNNGFDVLPIRTPTVPPGTERLRFSLSAAIPLRSIDKLASIL